MTNISHQEIASTRSKTGPINLTYKTFESSAEVNFKVPNIKPADNKFCDSMHDLWRKK